MPGTCKHKTVSEEYFRGKIYDETFLKETFTDFDPTLTHFISIFMELNV